ncbi:protein kinase domain-containing protein [Streptosporangium sp. NPDC004631]
MTERKVAGRYRLLEPIGEGGMGVVWRSHDELLDRVVAIKEVRYRGVDEAARADLNRRTIREAKSAGRLDHPSVIIVHDVVEEEGRPWVVMQLVRSRSLGEIIRTEGPLSPERVASVGLHVLGALRAAHAAGVLHRDVKPENVLLADDGRVVLTDFGIASMAHETGITRTGGMIGTPAFLPPERLHGLPATPESDLWSLGATLYAALEGRPPFERDTAAATMMAVLHGEPRPMAHTGPLTSAILGLLAREPVARTAADEAAALLTLASSGRGAGRPASSGEAGVGAHPPRPGAAPHHPLSPHPGHPGSPARPGGPPYPEDLTHRGGPVYPGEPARPGVPGHQSGPVRHGEPRYPNDPARHGAPLQDNRPAHPGETARPAVAVPPGRHPQHASPQHSGPPSHPGGLARSHHRDGSAPTGHPSHPGDPTWPPYRDGPTAAGYPAHPGPPPQPGHRNDPPHPGRPPYGTGSPPPGPRSHRGRPGGGPALAGRLALTVGVPALALAVGIGGWLLLQGPDDATPNPPTSAAGSSGGTTGPDTPSGGPRPTAPSSPSSPSSSSPPSAVPDRPARLPAGWRLYQDPKMGFSVAMPRGWTGKRFPDRNRMEFREPGSDAFLWIESTEDPETDPVRHWEKVERGGLAKKAWPGYRRLGVTPLRYRGAPAADWEFTYLKNDVPTHVLDRGFRTASGRPYAIYWESPEAEWDRTFFDRFTKTFQP